MDDSLDILIYLDETLVRNLSSVLFNGYIDIRTHREVCDNSLSGKVHNENREQFFEEDRCAKDLREGYKSKNLSEADSYQNSIEKDNSFEASQYKRNENEIKQIYTSFSIHNNIMNSMSGNNMIRNISDISVNSISESEYIFMDGYITTISIVSYIETVLNVLNAYDIEVLNSLLKDETLGLINFTTVFKILTNLLEVLTKNNTVDLIVVNKKKSAFIIVNRSFFMNENASVYDKCDCLCRVFGKVIKTSRVASKISLLRKTTQVEYYEKCINQISNHLSVLEKNGIVLPKMPTLSIKSDFIEIMPISIFI